MLSIAVCHSCSDVNPGKLTVEDIMQENEANEDDSVAFKCSDPLSDSAIPKHFDDDVEIITCDKICDPGKTVDDGWGEGAVNDSRATESDDRTETDVPEGDGSNKLSSNEEVVNGCESDAAAVDIKKLDDDDDDVVIEDVVETSSVCSKDGSNPTAISDNPCGKSETMGPESDGGGDALSEKVIHACKTKNSNNLSNSGSNSIKEKQVNSVKDSERKEAELQNNSYSVDKASVDEEVLVEEEEENKENRVSNNETDNVRRQRDNVDANTGQELTKTSSSQGKVGDEALSEDASNVMDTSDGCHKRSSGNVVEEPHAPVNAVSAVEENRVMTRKRSLDLANKEEKAHSTKKSKLRSKSSDEESTETHDSEAIENSLHLDSSSSAKRCPSPKDDEAASMTVPVKKPKEGNSESNDVSEESEDNVMSEEVSLPFLERFRGSFKSLSRSDLEELIVQKLCEVITERSTVGELRKKAQALEEDQARWKEKVRSLTKQLREMDMVMKKYIGEVQKQNKDQAPQNIAPLRVTRSVGLQVSFVSNSTKANKGLTTNSNQSQITTSAETSNEEKAGTKHALVNVQNVQNTKKIVISQTTPPKKIAPDQKKQRPISTVNLRSATTTQLQQQQQQQQQNSPVSTNRTSPAQVTTVVRSKPSPAASPAAAARIDDNSSKIIDLTDDDDRQTLPTTSSKSNVQPTNVTVRPHSKIRLVNHIQQGQVTPASRVAYLVPTAQVTSSGSGTAQSRQLLIATPTVQQPSRQLLPSVPPLLYKGSTLLQPGSQTAAFVNQPATTVAKTLKHPAPLPQAPLNQRQKPQWKLLPPRPTLKITQVQTGIVLSWNMTLGPEYEPIESYQLYAYQENNTPPTTSLWKKVGDVKALPLPMACTLTQFMSGHKYHFAVRAVDHHSRIGPFSLPGTIVLMK